MKNLKLNDKVTVFDQTGVITDVVDETHEPHLYGVTFDDTQKTYVIEAGHIEVVEDRRPVTKRIKTLEDACRELNVRAGGWHPLVIELEQSADVIDSKDAIAYLKLRVIAAALNDGWEPKSTQGEGEWFYTPCFTFVSKDAYSKMCNEKKAAVCRIVDQSWSSDIACVGCGISYACVKSTPPIPSISGYTTRLFFKTSMLAEYAGRQFIEIWRDLILA